MTSIEIHRSGQRYVAKFDVAHTQVGIQLGNQSGSTPCSE